MFLQKRAKLNAKNTRSLSVSCSKGTFFEEREKRKNLQKKKKERNIKERKKKKFEPYWRYFREADLCRLRVNTLKCEKKHENGQIGAFCKTSAKNSTRNPVGNAIGNAMRVLREALQR